MQEYWLEFKAYREENTVVNISSQIKFNSIFATEEMISKSEMTSIPGLNLDFK